MRPPTRATRIRSIAFAILLLVWVAPALATPAASPVTIIGLTASNTLVRFSSATPGAITSPLSITGLQGGESIVAIDFRPVTAQLYALGITNTAGPDTGRLYVIDIVTGAATQIGAGPFSTTLADGASYGFDFNPVADRIRVVNDADQNLRLNPSTGTLVIDANVDHATSPEGIAGLAYDRNVPRAGATTLFGIDFSTNTLIRQGGVDGNPSPNNGVLTTIGTLGLVTQTPRMGFDITGVDGTAYASLQIGGLFGLYTINLSTGAATLVGNIGNGTLAIQDLSVRPVYKIFFPYIRH